MEQFRQVGEVLGSMKALMALSDDIPINKRQCSLILDIFTTAFTTIAAEIRENLRLEEKSTKWRSLDQPLHEIYRVFKEAELYLRHCLDPKDWWVKAVTLHKNKDCLELHIHNLLCNFPAVIEAIEAAGEISGTDPDEIEIKGVLLRRKYDIAWNDPKLFGLMYGEKYLVGREMCRRFESALREDQWLLVESLKEKKTAKSIDWTKNEPCLCDLLLKKLNGSDPNNLFLNRSSILSGVKDFQVRRRLGGGSQLKEIQWLGESFVMHHIIGEIGPLKAEISDLLSLSLSHPNILLYLCGFHNEEKQECFLVMEPMTKDLGCHIKENSSPRRRNLMSIPVIVDIMLQIARGMEYLHSRNIYHGDLNPTHILVREKTSSEGYFHVKVSGFGISKPDPATPFIWYAPEVLEEQGSTELKYSEKADVYSFGMVCFEILTGKVPFEDGHLQGDKMGRNIRAGERPLFPFGSPKFLVNLTKKCWSHDPGSRPSFGSVCRVLRYMKKFLVMNPEAGQPEMQLPVHDFCEIESEFRKKFGAADVADSVPNPVWQIPFQMFSFRLFEIEKARVRYIKDVVVSEDVGPPAGSDVKSSDTRSVSSEKKVSPVRRDADDPEKKRDTRSVGSNGSDKKNTPVTRNTKVSNNKEERKPSIPSNPRPRTRSSSTNGQTTREKHVSDSET